MNSYWNLDTWTVHLPENLKICVWLGEVFPLQCGFLSLSPWSLQTLSCSAGGHQSQKPDSPPPLIPPPPFFFRTIFSSDLFFSREDCMFDESCRDSIKQALWTKTTLSSRSHTQCLGMVFPYLKAYHVMQAVGCVWATAGFWKLHRTILNFPGLSDWTSALCFSHLPRRPQGQVNPNSVPTAPKSQLEM